MKKIELKDIRKRDYYYSEAIKTLRTNIQFSGSDIKAILITSCYPNEGKSDITISLAMELGAIGKKTLLLDADIRKSSLLSRYGVKKKVPGLSEFLTGQANVADIMFNTNYPGMDIVFSGRTAPNPSGLLGSAKFQDFLNALKGVYSYILIDTPPIATVIDAAVAAQYVDGAVLVIESEAVSYRVAQRALEQLRMSNCPIIGGVMNKVDTRKDKYYSHYYSKYSRYGYYYRKSGG